MLCVLPIAFGATCMRSFSSITPTSGQTITVTYTASGGDGGLAVIESVPAGWSANIAASPDGKIRNGGASPLTITWTAPASATTSSFTGQCGASPNTA